MSGVGFAGQQEAQRMGAPSALPDYGLRCSHRKGVQIAGPLDRDTCLDVAPSAAIAGEQHVLASWSQYRADIPPATGTVDTRVRRHKGLLRPVGPGQFPLCRQALDVEAGP